MQITHPCAAYTTMTFDLAFDLRGPIQGQRRGTGYHPDIEPKWFQTMASLPGQLSQQWPFTWQLTIKVKLKVKWRGTEYHTEIASALYQNGLNRQLSLRSNSMSNDGVTDIVLKLRQQVDQMVSSESYSLWASDTTITFRLAFDHNVKFRV